MRKLDFLVAGVQKGGTTALWHFLRQHPDVGLSASKELHFFDSDELDWAKPDYGALHAHFTDLQNKTALGEATPIYTFWPNCIERIAAYNPEIKLVVSLRDPALRAFSHWRMETARYAEKLSFGDAIRGGRARMGGQPHRVFSYVERGFYAPQIERLFRHFPSRQILFVSQADLKTDIAPTLDRIATFLGVAPFGAKITPETIFSHEDGAPIDGNDLRYLRREFAQDARLTAALTGIRVPDEVASDRQPLFGGMMRRLRLA